MKMFKRNVIITVTLLMFLSVFAGCGNKEPETSIVSTVKNEAVTAEWTASACLIDSWTESSENSKTYYNTILVHSEDFFSCPLPSDVKYKTDDGYEPLTDIIPHIELDVYCVNKEAKKGVCAYIKIASQELLDLKKTYVFLEGPSQYIDGFETKEDYKDQKDVSWVELLASISSKSSFFGDAARLQMSLTDGVIRLPDKNASQFYYSSTTHQPEIKGNKLLTRFTVEILNETSKEDLVAALIGDGKAVELVAGAPQDMELDPRLRVCGEVIDDQVWLGFETIDGSPFDAYDGKIPDGIAYDHVKISYFLMR